MLRVDELLKATAGCLVSGKKDSLIKGISIDSRDIKKGEAFIAIKGNNFDGHNFIDAAIKKGASCIIQRAKGPKRPLPCRQAGSAPGTVYIEVRDTVRALGDIARYQRCKFNIPVIAITGTNGKTTTKDMVAWVLSKSFKVLKNEGTKNNQIGLSLALLNLDPSHEVAVLELGTNHFGEIDYLTKICLPNIGVITNIGPAHLEHFHSLKGVLREKYNLIENLKGPQLTIFNSDDNLLRTRLSRAGRRPFVLSFGIERKSDFIASQIRFSAERIRFLARGKYKFTLKTLGYHNIYNALAAIAIARVFGIEYGTLARQLAVFEFPCGRLKLKRLNRMSFIDDTYNSNPSSLEQALNALTNLRIKGRRIFVMGDMLELGSRRKTFHHRIGQRVGRVCDVFITVGRLSELAASAAKSFGFDAKNIFTCASVEQARDILVHKISACRDDLILVKGSRAMKMEEIFKPLSP